MSRILHIIAHLEKGGAERQLQLLVGASRHQHIVMVPAANMMDVAFDVRSLSSLSFWAVVRDVRTILRSESIDIIQLWLPERLTVPALLAARLEGVSVISSDRRKPRAFGLGALRDRLQYIPHLGADRIIPNYPIVSPPVSLRRMLGFARKTQTIANGMATPMAAVPDFEPVASLLTVARLIPQKRTEDLVETVASDFPDLELDVVGDGPELPRLQDLAGAAPDRITFHGRLSDWGVRFGPENRVLVLPSVSEGMSNVVFEAMAHGFPVICRETPEFAAMTADWAARPTTFGGKTGRSLAGAIREVSRWDAVQRRGHVLAVQAELGRYSVQAMAAAYDGVYTEIGRRASNGVEAL